MFDSDKDKQDWVERHARLLQQRFEQWQTPLGIDGEQYYQYLRSELATRCEEPLMKSLIETLS